MEKVVDINKWHKEHVKSEQDLQNLFTELNTHYHSDPYTTLAQRLDKLKQLKSSLLEQQSQLVAALNSDYGHRSEFDSLICDVLPAVNHINYTIKHLKKWMKPSKRHAGMLLIPSKVRVEYQPLGVVGVIAPWNFPIVLSIAPIVTAIAAGNRVMVKLSEHTPATNVVLSQICSVLDKDVYVVEGDAEIATHFSSLPFHHLIFTGSTKVGKLVAKAAASNLTPVTLELGGKSPVLIAHDADIKRAVDAIMLGKSINAGQICVAPDYVLLPQGKELQFIECYLERFFQLYVEDGELKDATHIVNEAQHKRLLSYLQDAKDQGATIHTIDYVDHEQGQLLPQLITGVTEQMLVMKEEIFGPILPVIGYRHLNEALTYINSKPRPLALYLMSDDKLLQQQIIEQTHSGGVAFNDTLLHVAADDAPFGGIGESGIGHYHGEEGFRTFSKAKTVLSTLSWIPRSGLLLEYRSWLQKVIGFLFLR
ncbi:coniferyl aldehyde dehydrogenase [Vibrio orientalis CIP 102891 = ATCC 33934]|uniref:Aldehyde dehydrogenase n=1 Tax=Vibrio orientalis CIP 102891 = ATCC 33934 TaxID=675816 RepID=C9QEH0_VIBOR|nr:coniferyl aldehyde dehydrogenase [Vibrio orientalis]EEX94443.1 aldehyde dehydrogenase [Vibrio orientalis CIP 102891 = ATCC 33934]EGU54006.1 coniferyl aldehyde dehydrogenase [Vibrio orientalis CIP 102891 = ATCC 33934]